MSSSPVRMVRLVLCAAAALFWELALIRWQGSCIRIVAYYSNFILISAFFGLGAGALVASRPGRRWERFLTPALAVALLLGVALGRVAETNPGAGEFVWIGAPLGIEGLSRSMESAVSSLPYWVALGLVYLADAAVFFLFGQWLGRLFRDFTPLRGYALEIGGSIVGILGFGAVSGLHVGPVGWFAIGFALVLLALDRVLATDLVACGSAAVALAVAAPFSSQFVWSPYYKIDIQPLTSYRDDASRRLVRFSRPIGYTLEVNNDYHQMMLDLHPRKAEPSFLASWRQLYELPYAEEASLPKGPVLVVGAGTGNDVAAALRKTGRRVDAVDIDPVILRLGRRFHPERPYDDPRVRVTVDDARSYFHRTRERYAIVVFGFLDSHTLLSSYSSLRLDNFVYTRESLRAVRDLVLPGGRVYLTFAANTPWLSDRILALLNATFDAPTQAFATASGYANGVIFRNERRPGDAAARAPAAAELPSDDWPFFYLPSRTLPPHYVGFMVFVTVTGFGALLLLPRGERRIRLPYFFLGAAFFLIETSNVVRLSLLYGSTWIVNLVVFTGILLFVLLGTIVASVLKTERPGWPHFSLLAATILIAWSVPTSALLGIDHPLPRAAGAVVVFLSPVLVASVVFGLLVRREQELASAYGSNVLGAVIGGASEYFSLILGFRALLLLTLVFYALVFLLLRRRNAIDA